MQLPKWHETFIPILEVLKGKQVLHYNDLRKQVRDRFYGHLPKELLEKRLKSGDISILNRIGWAKSALKIAKLIHYPERGMVQITDKGLEVLKNGKYDLQDLENDPEHIEYVRKRDELKIKDTDFKEESATPEEMIDAGISDIESEVKAELLDKLKGVDPYYFEKVVLQLLSKMGYGDFVETAKSGDGGIDGIINQDQLGLEKIYIQAKRYSQNNVREMDIRNFIGAMSGDTSKGVFVTTSDFDSKAVAKARDAHHKIILINGGMLVDLMYKYGVGVQLKTKYLIKQLDEDFFEG